MTMNVLLQVTAIEAVASIVLLAFRRMPATGRHVLCAVALLVGMLTPFIPQVPLPYSSKLLYSVGNIPNTITVSHLDAFHWITIAWLAGTAAMLARYVLGALYLRWRTRHREPVTDWPSVAPARVYATAIEVPVLSGWLRPVILVPLNFREWNEAQKRAAILHESQHIARADNWTSLIWITARALYWFHPLIWWISAEMQQQQELACDERVLASGIDSSEYAALLLDTAARLTSSNLLACTMVSSKGELKRRIEHILSFSRPPQLTCWNGLAICTGVLLMLIAAVAIPARALPHTAGQETIYTLGPGITPPRVIKKIEPPYSPSARQRKIQGLCY